MCGSSNLLWAAPALFTFVGCCTWEVKSSQRSFCKSSQALFRDSSALYRIKHAVRAAVCCSYHPHPPQQALGTAIASELDLAYWHARYTAASRFDAGCVTANPSSSLQVVPPPEVYFVGLAFHVPSVTELRALPLSPALRKTLAQVFDLPVDDAEVVDRPSPGVYACMCFVCVGVWEWN